MAAKMPKGSAIIALSSRDRRLYVASSIGATLGLVVGIVGEQLQNTGAHGHSSVSGAGWLVIILGVVIALASLANCRRLLQRGRRSAEAAEAGEAGAVSPEGVPGQSA